MIKYIPVKNSYKVNWLDDQGVLVGWDDFQQCCEEFGHKVYEKESGKPVFDDPDGLPYHFAKSYETTTDEKNTDEMNSKKNIEREYCGNTNADIYSKLRCFQIMERVLSLYSSASTTTTVTISTTSR